MKKLSFISKMSLILGAFVFLFSSCDKKPVTPIYKGENELILKADKQTINDVEGDAGKLTVNLLLTQSLDKDLTLKFEIDPATEACSLENAEVVIAKGAKTGVLTVKAKGDGSLKSTLALKIKLVSSSDEKVKLKEEVSFSVIPGYESTLTPAQKELVEHYKKDKFNKLYVSLLGNTEVKFSVKYPGDANFTSFPEAGEKEYTSTTLFTLSEKATKETLVLKMEKNAMGLNDFLYDVLTNMTHENEFWGNPFAEHAKRLIDFEKFKEFNVALDNIEREGHGFSFVSTIKNNSGDDLKAVPFTYTYSAWDEFQKYFEKDAALKEFIKEQKNDTEGLWNPALSDGTLNPAYYLNQEDIVDNQFPKKTLFTKSEVSFDHATYSLIFTFCLAYEEADDYMQFKASYQLKK